MPSEMLNVGWNVRIEGYEWSMDNQVEIDKGWIQRADSLSELASKIGLDAATLEETVRRYNRACASKVDEAFGRAPATLTPITEPPFSTRAARASRCPVVSRRLPARTTIGFGRPSSVGMPAGDV